MKKIILISAVIIATGMSPVTAMAGEGTKLPSKLTATAGAVMEILSESKTQYANSEAPIHEGPSSDSQVLGTSRVNTSFQVLSEEQGWGMVSTAEGFAFVETVYLSDAQIVAYSEQDLYVLAHVLAGEAQSLPDEEQRYVGSVVLNRVKHPSFPSTIEGVVFQRGQYACTWDGNYYREPTARNWENARFLLENGSVLPENVVWQSGRKQGKGIYIRTQWHCYCY